jgi:uncharacterized LabA/DUF88 family protein
MSNAGKPERAEWLKNQAERLFLIRGRQPGQRMGLFIDVQNLFYSAKHLHQAKVNYRRLLEDLSAGRKLVRAVAYMVTKPEVDQSAFVDALTRMGYETKIKYLKIRPDGTAKGDWAMEMSLDIMSMASRLDVVTLVTGDGDYVPLVHRLKVLGCRVEVVGFPQNTATELMNAAHAFLAIDDALIFKEKKFEAELAAAATQASPARGVPPPTRSRGGDSIAERFAAGDKAPSTGDMGVFGKTEEADPQPSVDDATAERLASQLWERENTSRE